MGSLNKVILIGNLGSDPEVRFTQGGTAVGNFRIATSERFKKGDDWEERTEWHRITVWGKVAENCGQYLSKGSQVCVEGRLQTRKWEDRDGNDRYTTEVVAREVVFLSSKNGGSQRQGRDGATPDGYDGPPPPGADDPDIPF